MDRERLVLAARLLPGTVHNISGALQLISMPLDLMDLSLERGDLPGAREKLKALQEGCERLFAEMDRMSQRAHCQTGLEPEPLDPADLANQMLDYWRGDLFYKHQVQVNADLTTGLGRVMVAPADLALAFNALVANALEAQQESDDPGLRVSLDRQGDHLQLQVSDAGPGVDAQLAQRIFEPFVGTKPGAHQGLGLFLAREALAPWGGGVAWLPSESQTTFRITLPEN